METVAKSTAGEDLDLLRHWNPPPDYGLIRTAAIGSLLLHFLVILWLGTVHFNAPPPDETERRLTRVTPLVDPPTELTQRAPNRAKVTKQINIGTILPTAEVHTPVPTPPRPKPRMITPPPAPAQTARNVPAPKILDIEPPKVNVASNAPVPQLPNVPVAQAPPPAPPAEKPKLSFETPNPTAAPVNKTPNPALFSGNPIQDAVRNVARTGATGGQRVSVADLPSAGPSLNLPSSPGVSQPELELKSDPMGVDFKPYLIRVLATVRRNWFAIYPEAARLGMRGQVGVEFVVAKDGSIPKVVYSAQSGNKPLDEAAVAALSASNPLPPLPTEFRGQRVVLQFTFSYNIPKR